MCCRLIVGVLIIKHRTLELIETYSPDVVIGTESWLKEDITNFEIFRADFTTFRRDKFARGGGIFIFVKNIIASTELRVEDDFGMIAV